MSSAELVDGRLEHLGHGGAHLHVVEADVGGAAGAPGVEPVVLDDLATPASLAVSMIVAPEPVSRLVSTMTLAPSAIACSAWDCWVWASPSALTMVKSSPSTRPASSKDCWKYRRSSFSQRSEDAVSGSSTQMLAVAAAAVARCRSSVPCRRRRRRRSRRPPAGSRSAAEADDQPHALRSTHASPPVGDWAATYDGRRKRVVNVGDMRRNKFVNDVVAAAPPGCLTRW